MSDKDRRERVEKKEEDIIEGEIIAEFSGETLLSLPPIPDEKEQGQTQAGTIEEEYDVGRRRLITRLALGGVAALALGGGAAVVWSQSRRNPAVVILPNGAQISAEGGATDVAALVERITQLEYELASVTAERDQLISDLHNANAELEQLRPQLEQAQALNALWQSLDDIGLDDLLETGLSVVGGLLAGVLGATGLLRNGLVTARDALESFTRSLPGPQAGIRWLQQQVSALADALEWLGQQVQRAVEPVEPYTEMIANFVLWVLGRLPFGAGEKARAGMEAMQSVISSLPTLIDGINTGVLNPLADWFGENENLSLSGILLKPISDGVIKPANDTLVKFSGFESGYQDQLAGPVGQALTERAAIRAQIQQLRAQAGSRS